MSSRVRTTLALLLTGVLLVGLTLGYGWHAVHEVQPFYAAALQTQTSDATRGASRELETRVAALYSDAVQQQTWQAAFSAAEVNAWLAVALQEKYVGLLPESISDPRVAFDVDRFRLGFRFKGESFAAVVSVEASAFVAESDELAIRFRSAHAGTLPLPLAKVIEPLNDFARENQIALRWSQQDGDPVALIPLQGILSTEDEQRRLETIELQVDELLLAGKSELVHTSVAQREPEHTQR